MLLCISLFQQMLLEMDKKCTQENLFTAILSNFLLLIKQPREWFQVHKFPCLRHFFPFTLNIGDVTTGFFSDEYHGQRWSAADIRRA